MKRYILIITIVLGLILVIFNIALKKDSEALMLEYYTIYNQEPKYSWTSIDRNSEFNNENYFVFESVNDLITKLPIKSQDSIGSPYPPKEILDFNSNRFIGVYLTRGLKPSGGYRLDVDNISLVEDNKIEVRLVFENPKGPVPDVEMYNVTIIKLNKKDIPKGNVTISFIDQENAIIEEQNIYIH